MNKYFTNFKYILLKMSKIIFCFLFLFCLTKAELYEGAKVYEIKKDSNGQKEISLKVKEGEDFALKFRGNPTTGYTWVLLNTEEVNGPLKATNFESDGIAEYVAESKDKLLVGGAGNFYYKFKALKVDNEEKVLKFSYRRTWEKNQNNEPDFIVKIKVE